MAKMDRAERFMRHVDKRGADECWIWTGVRLPTGYGMFHWETTGPDRRGMTASRAAFLLFNGPLEPRQHACHRCDNPPCCNPAHLFAGTAQDNLDDARNKQRLGYQRGIKRAFGTRVRKLSDDDVRAIRDDSRHAQDVADYYEVDVLTIYNIRACRRKFGVPPWD